MKPTLTTILIMLTLSGSGSVHQPRMADAKREGSEPRQGTDLVCTGLSGI